MKEEPLTSVGVEVGVPVLGRGEGVVTDNKEGLGAFERESVVGVLEEDGSGRSHLPDEPDREEKLRTR